VRPLKHLIVFIPGLGGSVLTPGPVRLADLDVDRDLVPADVTRSVSVLAPMLAVPGFDGRFLHRFAQPKIQTYRPPEPIHRGTDVLLFPYDYRRSVTEAADGLATAVEQWLGHLAEPLRSRRVIVVAHGTGGLVARYWLGPLGGHPRCQALITLGTPHRGLPLALDWLVNGVRLAGVADQDATRVIRGWPSMYELLPQYDAVWNADAGEAFELTELPELRDDALSAFAPVFAEAAKRGRRTHEDIATAWAAIPADQRPDVIPFAGRGHRTPSAVYLDGGRLWLTSDDPHWRGCVGWRGDGMVPLRCAVSDELTDRQRWHTVGDRQIALGAAPGVVDVLRHYAGDVLGHSAGDGLAHSAGDGQVVAGGDLPDRPWLGLGLDGVVPARHSIPVWAEVLPDLLTATGATATISPVDGERAEPLSVELAPLESGGWTGTLPPCVPGLYRVRVEARGVPVFDRLAASDVVAAV
jgi:hypothetical protein